MSESKRKVRGPAKATGVELVWSKDPPSPELILEYVPNADFEMWFQRVSKGVITAFVSLIVLIFMCQACYPLQEAIYAFFRWVLIPVKPLLTAAPPAVLSAFLDLVTPFCHLINLLMIPLIGYAAIRGQRMKTYLAVDDLRDRLLLVQPSWSGKDNNLEGIHIAGTFYAVLKSVPLKYLDGLEISRPKGKRSILDYNLVFKPVPVLQTSSSGSNWKSIRWGDIIKAEDRQKFLAYLEKNRPKGFDASILEPFRLLPERQSYTELWLQELSGAPKRDKLTPLSEGSTLAGGKYKILRKVGMGGQATVYLAHSDKHPQEDFVVLKEFMLPVYPDIRVRKKAAERFHTEAAMLSRLNHPQIARFFDLFLEDHRAYLVLEHVDGASLKDLVAGEGVMPETAVIDAAKQICRILIFMHGQDPPVIHRDLTPDNIMLEDGRIKLIDFSVAQEATSGVTGSVVGKPNYISPEQFRGKPTIQSDLYSLGATLYYLLCGHEPPPISVLHPIREKETLSPALDAVIARCTQLDVQKRYGSAQEVLDDLNSLDGSNLEFQNQFSASSNSET